MDGLGRIQYPYAYDESGSLVYIENVNKVSRYDHKFTCPNCGKTMIPRLGEHNAHCFSHDKGKACGKESYIHFVAKEILAKRFNQSKSFHVKLWLRHVCNCNLSCTHYDFSKCEYREEKEFDLKEFYDLPATNEQPLSVNGKEFIPDVLLQSSNKKWSPIFLEIYFKHKSTEEKTTDNKCIEFRVKDFTDLKKLETESIEESESIGFKNFKRFITPDAIESHIRQKFLLKNCQVAFESSLPYCKQSEVFKRRNSKVRRWTLYKSGEYREIGILENEISEHEPGIIADVTYYYNDDSFNPLYTLALKDNRFRGCDLCEHKGHCLKEIESNNIASYCESFEWDSLLTDDPSCDPMLNGYIEGKNYFIWVAEE